MSLKEAKMRSLRDKIESQAEEVKEKLQREDIEEEKIIKKSAKKN